MKKLLAIVLTVTLLLSSVLVAIPVNAAGETEPTRALPVALPNGYTPEGKGIASLNEMSGDPNNKYYLTQNITVTGRHSFPSGATLDGNGHTITVNRSVTSTTNGDTAIFGYTNGGTVKNVIITGTMGGAYATSGSTYNDGILSNGFEGSFTVENVYCDVNYTVTAGTIRHLGFLGKNESGAGATLKFKNVVNAANFTVNQGARVERLGGFIGWANCVLNIENSTYSGKIDVNGNSKWVGGFVGYSDKSVSITGSTFSGSVSTTATYDNTEPITGGMIGTAPIGGGSAEAPAIKLENNTISGDVEHLEQGRKGHVGGMMGYGGGDNAVIVVNNCDSTTAASVNVSSYTNGNHVGVAGLIGTVRGGSTSPALTITNCDAKGTVTLTVTGNGHNSTNLNTQVAGVIARVNNMKEVTINGCTNSGAVTVVSQMGNGQTVSKGWDGVAGIVAGFMTRSGATDYEIYNCVNSGAITGHGAVAGILGTNCQFDSEEAVIYVHDCINSGKITEITNSGHAGGIAGNIGGSDNGTTNFWNFKISNCVNVGEVVTSTGWCVGGILGQWDNNGTVRRENADEIATIENCVNAGYVHSTKWAGRAGDPWICAAGMVGNYGNPLAIKNCVNVGNVSTANNVEFYGAFPIANTVEARTAGDLAILEASGNIYLDGSVGMPADKFTDSTKADKATVYAKLKALNTYGYSTAAVEAEIRIFSNDMVRNDYLPGTWTEYALAVETMRGVLDTYIKTAPLSRYQYQLNYAEMAVIEAKAALVKKVDFYKPITDAIAATEGLVENDYTKGSWANLQLAINAGNSLMTQVSEDAAAVANAATAITAAQGALIDAGLLGDIYDAQARADALTEENYTAASWATMEEKYEAAQDVVDNYSDDLDKIEAAAKDLNDAIDALVNISELKNAIATTIEEEKYYTEYSYAEYTAKLSAANTALTATTQAEVDAAKDNLLAAIDALEYKLASEGQLDDVAEKIENANALNENYYTEETWNEFTEALAKVEALNASSTMAEVDAAMKALEVAQGKLVKSEASASDYEILEGLINSAYELEAEDYVADTYNALMEKVSAAEALSDAETKETIEAAIADIEEAFELLVKAPEADTAEEELEAKIEGLSVRNKIAVAIASKRKPAQSNKNLSAIVDALA